MTNLYVVKHGNVANNWSKPTIFENTVAERPYPIDALPRALQKAVLSYQSYGKQPLSMVACSAIANISLACQAMANVARDKLLISPISLYFILCAGSGERKSVIDHTFNQSIRKWQHNVRENLFPEVIAAKSKHQIWRVEKNGILAKIRRSSTAADDIYILQRKLMELNYSEPKVPLLPMLFFEDATPEALAAHFATGWPSAALASDEGGTIVGAQAMNSSTTKLGSTTYTGLNHHKCHANNLAT